MRTVVVDVTVTKRYSVKITDKYKWAVDTGRFQDDEIKYAARMGEVNAPEATYVNMDKKVTLVEIRDDE